jgi:hypothetical protein
MQRNKQMTAQVMNNAFSVYYRAHQAARQITSVLYGRKYSQEAQKKIWELQSKVEADIRSAADKWSYNDMKRSFEHLEKTGGVWKDDTWDGWKGVCNIPSGVSDFLDTLEKRGREVIGTASEWNRYQSDIKRAKEEQRWESLKDPLEKAEWLVEKIGPKLWVGVGCTAEAAETYGRRMAQAIGWGGKAHEILSLYLKVRYGGPNWKETAFVEGMAMLVQGLPVFGTLYAQVIRGIPNLVTFFQRYSLQTARAINGQF